MGPRWLSREVIRSVVLLMLVYTWCLLQAYCQTSNISGTSVGDEIVDHSDVAGASPVGAAPTTSSFLI